ncbi:hypothetical protein FHW72_000341 [Ochrobactrum sp. RC6B]|nr:hypothetical protein [Ochrobactrum sp. RC6B]MBB3215295.1 hypothetical protein [Ochrobactrum sp. RC6B]
MEKSFTGRFNARSIAGNACSFFTHYPAQNRFALLLEMLALFLRIIPRKTASHFCWKCLLFFYALSRAKPLRTFAGNACSFFTHYPAQNRSALLLEMLALFLRIILHKTASHFCWKCWMKKK